MKKKYFLFLLAFILLGGLIYYSDAGKVLENFSEINIYIFLSALLLWIGQNGVKIYRWKYFLSKSNIEVSFRELTPVLLSGLFLTNITPGRVGDPARTYILKKSKNKPIGKTISSVVIERMLDVLVLISLCVIGLGLLSLKIPEISFWLEVTAAFFIFLVLLGIYILSSKDRTTRVMRKFQRIFSFIPKIRNLRNEVEEFSKNLNESFVKYKNKKIVLTGFALTTLIWLLEGGVLLLAFYSLGLQISFLIALAIIPISLFIGVISFLPGTLGTNEIVSAGLFLAIYTFSLAEITTAVLLYRFITFWMYILIGSVIFTRILKEG